MRKTLPVTLYKRNADESAKFEYFGSYKSSVLGHSNLL